METCVRVEVFRLVRFNTSCDVAAPLAGMLVDDHMAVIWGGAMYVKSLAVPGSVVVPPAVVTDTLTVPLRAGALTTICVSESDVKLAALTSVLPKLTLVAPMKSVPVMVTGIRRQPGPGLG